MGGRVSKRARLVISQFGESVKLPIFIMNKQSYESLIEHDVDGFISALMPHGGGATITEQRLRLHLATLIKQIARHSRSYELMNLRTSDDLAIDWGVSKRRVQAIITERHERFGAGMKVGRDWILSADEAERYKPDPSNRNGGRPKKGNKQHLSE